MLLNLNYQVKVLHSLLQMNLWGSFFYCVGKKYQLIKAGNYVGFDYFLHHAHYEVHGIMSVVK